MKRLFCILCLLMPVTASAQPAIGYLSLHLGAVSPKDSTLHPPAAANTTLTSKNGYLVGISAGQRIKDGWNPIAHSSRQGMWRLESELDYRQTDDDKLNTPGSSTSVDGKLKVWDLMGNALLDLPTVAHLTPYLGIGIGGAHIKASFNAISGHDNVFAYQGIAGINFAFDPVIIGIDYRYFATADASIKKVDMEYKTNNLSLDIRYRF